MLRKYLKWEDRVIFIKIEIELKMHAIIKVFKPLKLEPI